MVGLFIVRKLTTEEFIGRATKIHSNKYKYDKVDYYGSFQKVIIGCEIHGDFTQIPSSHLQGIGCPKCGAKLISKANCDDLDSFIDKARLKHGKKYTYEYVTYKNSRTNVSITCPTHGKFIQKPSNHLFGSGCPRCPQIKTITTEEFITISNTIHKGRYSYEGSIYKNLNSKVLITCTKHGNFLQQASVHMRGHGCSKCRSESIGAKFRSNTQDFLIKSKLIHGDRFEYGLTRYESTELGVIITCKIHGNFIQSPHMHLLGNGCQKCGGTSLSNTDEFINRSKVIHQNKYDYGKVNYITSKQHITILCKKHGTFLQTPMSHLQGQGCPKCASSISKGETELHDFIKSLFPDTYARDRKIIKPKELDIVIPSKKVAIEYNGLYFHSDKFPNAQNKHKEKLNSAKQAGYKLIHVYEDDWLQNQDVVKHTLKHILGVSEERLYARKLKVVELPHSETKGFFTSYHMQGSSTGGVSYCLVDRDNTIQAAMQFKMSSSERGVSDTSRWELIRFATRTSVVGGASKLFKAFVKDNPSVETIISYSDNDMFDGNLYNILGFTVSHKVAPDYKVVVSGKRYHKSNFRRDKLQAKYPEQFNPDLTEKENCHALGFYRIYNSGLIKWVWLRA